MKHSIFLLLTLFILTSCQTSYTNNGAFGGYKDIQISETTWKVSSSGNAYTSQSKIADIALLRAAENTLDKGYKYFFIISDDKSIERGSYTTNGSASTTGSFDTFGNFNSNTTYRAPQTTNTVKHGSEIVYKMLMNEVDGYMIYNAQFVYDSLAPSYIN